MRRPFALMGFAALAALTVAACWGPGLPPALAPVCAGLGVCALLALGVEKAVKKTPLGSSRPGAFFLALTLCLSTASLCFLRYEHALEAEFLPAEGLDGAEARIRGTVLDYPEEAYHKWYYLIRVERASVSGKRVDLPEFTARISTGQPFACGPCGTVECTVQFSAFDSSGGPYSTRNSRWAKGAAVGGYLSDYGDVETIPTAGWPFSRLLAALRRHIGRSFEELLPEEEAGLIRAILLGEKDRVPATAYGNFRKIGSSHLLVVSGLHMSSLAAMVSLLLGRLPLKRWAKSLLTALAVLFFLALIGMPVSAVRSGVMFLLYLLAGAVGRRPDNVNSLGAAVLLICLVSPLSGGDVGFALSVSSTLGIQLWARPISRRLSDLLGRRARRAAGWAADSLGVTFSAMLATFPIQLAVFGGVSLLAPLANLILVFPCTLLLYAALLAPWLGYPLAFCAGWLARFVLSAAEGMARIPAAFLDLSQPAWALAAALLSLLAIAFSLLGWGRTVKCLFLAVSLALFGLAPALGSGSAGGGAVTLAAAADSSCVLVIRDSRASVLALGGFRTGAAASLLSRYNVRRVETLCLPVRDQDARESAVQILESYGADSLALPADAYLGRDLALAAGSSGRIAVRDGVPFQLMEGITATAHGDMARLDLQINSVAVSVETAASGKGSCQVLFTQVEDSGINSAFTVFQNDDILEETGALADAGRLAGFSPGRYLFPGGEGLSVVLLPDGTVKLRGETLCLK